MESYMTINNIFKTKTLQENEPISIRSVHGTAFFFIQCVWYGLQKINMQCKETMMKKHQSFSTFAIYWRTSSRQLLKETFEPRKANIEEKFKIYKEHQKLVSFIAS